MEKRYLSTTGNDCEKAIISIGMDLILRAKEIASDLDDVSSITIHAELTPCELANYDITKNRFVKWRGE